MSRIPRLLASASTAVTRPAVVHRFLAGVEGVRHVPAEGPFVLVPNHSSFADHLLLDAVLDALRDSTSYYLTKAEAFDHPVRRMWTEGMGGIPVDRGQPGRELLKTVDRVFSGGSALVVYPEGTRGSGWPLLPFKDGAFRFAVRSGVPVVPVGMWGAQHILPKGASWPRGTTARIVFGAPLADDVSLSRPRRVAELTEQARSALETLVDMARLPSPQRDQQAAQELAERAAATVETMLSRTDKQPAARRMHQARVLLDLARLSDSGNTDARVTRSRLIGLRALSAPAPLRPVLLRGMRRDVEQALRDRPDHLMAHYLLGRWHLMTPRLLGGRRDLGLAHLRDAASIGAGDTRFPMAYAEALMAAGRTEEAAVHLRSVLSAPAPDRRTADRRSRAATHYNRLSHATGTPASVGGVQP